MLSLSHLTLFLKWPWMGVKLISDEKRLFHEKPIFLHGCFFMFLVENVIFEVFESRAQKCHFRVKMRSPAFPEDCFLLFQYAFSGHMGFKTSCQLFGTKKMVKKTTAEKHEFCARGKINLKNRIKKEGLKK